MHKTNRTGCCEQAPLEDLRPVTSCKTGMKETGCGRLAFLHQDLDRAVDRCYWPEPFPSDRHRVEYLFALYEKLTAPLAVAAEPARRRRKAQPIA